MNHTTAVDPELCVRQLKHFLESIEESHYIEKIPLQTLYTYDQENPIPLESLNSRDFYPLEAGEKWGDLWGSAWMKFCAAVPDHWRGREVVALIDLDAEGCVFRNGTPVQGLTHKTLHFAFHRKRRVPLFEKAEGGEEIELLVEAAANEIGGQWGQKEFILRQAEAAVFDRERWNFILDFQYLLDLMENLPGSSVRARKIRAGLVRSMALWNDGAGFRESRSIASELLDCPACASALTSYSQGHAHLDLAWLWPIRETRRKAGRTFSTALRLLSEYPEYKFGASQPQLYQWVKEDYPEMYGRIKEAVTEGRWECQGAMWVEPDMNLVSGESMVRQCVYGLKFYGEEFGVQVRNLWLPDVFGFSAALPQILKKCGVDHFLSIKISWNDTNEFPHSSFWWEGIDGSRVLTHFPPAKEYHTANKPKDQIFSQENFKETGVSDSFLNLYGIGDGGGGPSRQHIEFGLRGRNCEGMPRMRFEYADTFFSDLEETDGAELPVWNDELYLEFHRGTYTSQARLKQLNRRVEHLFRDTELLAAMTGEMRADDLEEAWKTLLLHQFHDILPGSSITRVNREARQALTSLKEELTGKRDSLLQSFCREDGADGTFILFNPLSWERRELVRLPLPDDGNYGAADSRDSLLQSSRLGRDLYVRVTVPSLGYETVRLVRGGEEREKPAAVRTLENNLIRIELDDTGALTSLFDKRYDREWLSGRANRLLLWEDDPYRWDAWEITPYYRNTTPEPARLTDRRIESNGMISILSQELAIGRSRIRQVITLTEDSPLIEISNEIDWREEHKMLKVHAETDIRSDQATFEIQYGSVKRSARNNNSWQQAQFEVPGHRFADLSDGREGFALLNDSSYGYRIKDGELEQTLLRSPRDPDSEADKGVHRMKIAYLPHEGDCSFQVLRRAHELNSPLIVHKGEADRSRGFPGRKSLFSLIGDSVKLEAVKPSYDGKGLILRLYETGGTRQSVELCGESGWLEAYETDLLENIQEKLSGRTDRLTLDFKPYEIRTLFLC